MDVTSVLVIVLVLAATAACVAVVWGVVEAIRASREARTFVARLDARLMPLLDKAEITVDALNAELLRVDGIVTRFEDASERVSTTARAAEAAVSAPIGLVAEAGSALGRIFSSLGRRRG
ncbi:MAG: hypothetical protein C0418_01660 [Coriobacteriaceae bacterium]|nr:hypothetical protein [Coriobacteriaceae bacterium]